MKLAKRMDRILIETAFEVLVRARALEAQGMNIVHLEIGEPDFDTPKHIVTAAKEALDQGWTHYGPTQGYPELREAVILRDLQQLEYGEIQRVLAVPEGTVKSRINRGRIELARVLQQMGVRPS